jgi:hypothetical protein
MSEELRPCPSCEINDWQYHAHFSGATIRQCGGCGTIIDESIINTRPIEDELRKRIAELEEAQRWIPVSEPPIITHYNDAVSAGKVSVDVKTSTDNNKRE